MKGVLFNSSIQSQHMFTASLETWDPQGWRSSPPISRHPCGAFTHGEFRSHWTWRFRNSRWHLPTWPRLVDLKPMAIFGIFGFLDFLGIVVMPNSQRLNPSYGLHGSLPWLASNDSCGHRKHQPWKHPGCYEIISFSLATWKCHLLQPKRHQKVTPQNQQPEVPTCHHTIYFWRSNRRNRHKAPRVAQVFFRFGPESKPNP